MIAPKRIVHGSAVAVVLILGGVMPAQANGDAFTGLGIGGSLGRHNLEVEVDSTRSPVFGGGFGTRSNDSPGSGIGARLTYMGSIDNLGYAIGIQYQDFDIGVDINPDTEFVAEDLLAYIGHFGYVSGQNFVYGIVELGSMDFEYNVDGFSGVSGDLSSFGLGIGYARALEENAMIFVELVGRSLQGLEVTFRDTDGSEIGTDVLDDTTIGSLSVGFEFRF